jgi:predicted nucleic acid-binding protein
VTDTLVVNASPVIALARIGQLRLLEALAHPLVLPEAVAAEILAGPLHDAARAAVAQGFGKRLRPREVPARVVEWSLGLGETAVLALALEIAPATAVIDDSNARAAARAFGVPLIGTLGVVLRARHRGVLAAAAPILRDLVAAGLYLDERIVSDALARAGESWAG